MKWLPKRNIFVDKKKVFYLSDNNNKKKFRKTEILNVREKVPALSYV